MNETSNPVFKQLKFKRTTESRSTFQRVETEFFIPGVNSGVYKPATLVIRTNTLEKKARFFKWKKVQTYSTITLSPNEFDELFAEMEKIKKLRDALKL